MLLDGGSWAWVCICPDQPTETELFFGTSCTRTANAHREHTHRMDWWPWSGVFWLQRFPAAVKVQLCSSETGGHGWARRGHAQELRDLSFEHLSFANLLERGGCEEAGVTSSNGI